MLFRAVVRHPLPLCLAVGALGLTPLGHGLGLVAPSAAADEPACSVTGAADESLADAKALFEERCAGYVRLDCDPVAGGGGWSCSSAVIGQTAPGGLSAAAPSIVAPVAPEPVEEAPVDEPEPVVVAPPPEPEPEPEGLCFSTVAASLGAARTSFAAACAGFVLRDCDPVDGGWRCSSGIIGATAPGVSGVPAAVAEPMDASEDVSEQPIESAEPEVPASVPDVDSNGRRVGLLGGDDLLVLHYDNCPDRDDGHAIAAGYSVIQEFGLNDPWIVNGTCGDDIRRLFVSDSRTVMRAVWGDFWLDADANLDAAVVASADAWSAVLANGADVWVAEGGPSDFSARVVDRLRARNPELDLKRVHIVQHSSGRGFNERESQRIDTITRYTDYVTISDGNNSGNGTADFNEQSSSFVAAARASRYRTAWNAAFDYLTPDCTPRSGRCKLDFSDTVELLHILGDDDTLTVSDFADRYLR